jgi:hypothetical protein
MASECFHVALLNFNTCLWLCCVLACVIKGVNGHTLEDIRGVRYWSTAACESAEKEVVCKHKSGPPFQFVDTILHTFYF